MAQQLRIAQLDENAVTKIREIEQRTGKHIMAFEQGLSFAQLSEGELDMVQSMEQELGVVLIVYED